jgi:hypothetical protein
MTQNLLFMIQLDNCSVFSSDELLVCLAVLGERGPSGGAARKLSTG